MVINTIKDFVGEELSKAFKNGNMAIREFIHEELSIIFQGIESRIVVAAFEHLELDSNTIFDLINRIDSTITLITVTCIILTIITMLLLIQIFKLNQKFNECLLYFLMNKKNL